MAVTGHGRVSLPRSLPRAPVGSGGGGQAAQQARVVKVRHGMTPVRMQAVQAAIQAAANFVALRSSLVSGAASFCAPKTRLDLQPRPETR